MKFIHIIYLSILILTIAACSNAKKAPAVQDINTPSLAQPTNTLEIIAPASATSTPIAQTLPTSTSLPAVAEATPPLTPTPVESPVSPTPNSTEAAPTSPPDGTTALPTDEGLNTCTNIASFHGDVTVPDGTSFRQGDTFTKTWRIRNEGTCTWDASYALVFAGGEVMNAPLTNPLPDIPPGTVADISIDLTAPSRGGMHQSNWQFQNPAGERFGVGFGGGGQLWAQITVSFILPTQVATSGATPPSQGACSGQRDPTVEAQVLALINEARTNQGLNALEAQGQLAAAALAHSMDMACHDFVDHVGSDGSTWYDRVSAQGYANYNSARENIYVGHPEFGGTAQGAFDWWWNSKIHHDNMLKPDVSQIGVAYVVNPDSEYGGYYTTVFARP